eukprot:3684003-Pleurochrysis_carterae.AAC.1
MSSWQRQSGTQRVRCGEDVMLLHLACRLTDPLCRATTCHGDDVKSASCAYLRSHALLECSEK